MLEKNLLAKKQELMECRNNQVNSFKIDCENKKRMTFNEILEGGNLNFIVDSFSKKYPDLKFKTNIISAHEQELSIGLESYAKKISLYINKNQLKSINLPETVYFDEESHYYTSPENLKKFLEIAMEFKDFYEKSQGIEKHKILENPFEEKIDHKKNNENLEKINQEEKTRSFAGHVYKDKKTGNSYVITRFLSWDACGRKIFEDEKKLGREEKLVYPLKYIGDNFREMADLFLHDDYNKEYVEELPCPEWVKEIVPSFEKKLTFESFVNEFKFRINILNVKIVFGFSHASSELNFFGISNGRDTILSNDEESINAYKILGTKILSLYSDPENFKTILSENGIKNEKDFTDMLIKISSESVMEGIEKSADQMIEETKAKKGKDIVPSKTFNLSEIEKEIMEMVVSGNTSVLNPTALNKALETLKKLKKDGFVFEEELNSDVKEFTEERGGIYLEIERNGFAGKSYAADILITNETALTFVNNMDEVKTKDGRPVLNHFLLKPFETPERIKKNIKEILKADLRLPKPEFNNDSSKVYLKIYESFTPEKKAEMDLIFDRTNPDKLKKQLSLKEKEINDPSRS